MTTIKQLITASEAIAAHNCRCTMTRLHFGDNAGYPATAGAQVAECFAALTETFCDFLASATGAFKLLRVVNPAVFPIWIAVVYCYCCVQEAMSSSHSRSMYTEFTQRVHQAINCLHFAGKAYRLLAHKMAPAHKTVVDHYRMLESTGKTCRVRRVLRRQDRARYGLESERRH